MKLDNHKSSLEESYIKNDMKKLNDIIFNICDRRSSKPKGFGISKYPSSF